MTLSNPTSDRVAFKVKTTSPKKYCVRPSSGFVDANSIVDVLVILQAQKELPPSFTDCKDKFLVQCVKAPASTDIKEVTPDLFDASKGAKIGQIKMRVVMTAPMKPPSPVPEGRESEAASPVVTARALTAAATGGTVNTRSIEDTPEVKKRLHGLEANGLVSPQSVATAAATDGMKKEGSSAAGYTMFHLLIVALLAFLLGHIAQVALPRFDSLLKNLGLPV
jgi:hypothetical protein